MSFRTRKVAARDRSALVSIIEGTDNLSAEEMECAVELLGVYLEDPSGDEYLFAAAVDLTDTPAGYVCYGPAALADGVYDIDWILVGREKRGRGIGTLLLDFAESEAGAGGARMLTAETSGLPSYGPARSFYLSKGFCEEARISDFFKPGDDKVIFVKRL